MLNVIAWNNHFLAFQLVASKQVMEQDVKVFGENQLNNKGSGDYIVLNNNIMYLLVL